MGKRLVEVLVERGYPVRVLARKLSHIEMLKKLNVEIFFGDVADLESLRPAIRGHGFGDSRCCRHDRKRERGRSAARSRERKIFWNFVARCKYRKLIYISSCSVYGVADYKEGAMVREDAPLERFPEKRGHYSYCQVESESDRFRGHKRRIHTHRLPAAGNHLGAGGRGFYPNDGFSLGEKVFVIIGNGKFVLPFVHIDNLIEAIVKAIENQKERAGIYNVVDPER